MDKIGKSDLIDKIAAATKIEKTKIKDVIDHMLTVVTDTLKAGGAVQLTGFGTFSVSKREARKGVNPKNGQAITIPAKKVPKFTAGKGFKDAIEVAKPAKTAKAPAKKK